MKSKHIIFYFAFFTCISIHAQHYPINWETLTNVNENGNNTSFKANANTLGWGDAGGYSKNSIQYREAGTIIFSANSDDIGKAIGLSKEDLDDDYTSINYGILLNDLNEIWVTEDGMLNGPYGTYTSQTRFKIERNFEGEIRFYVDGIEVYIVNDLVREELLIDMAMEAQNAEFNYLEATFSETYPSYLRNTNEVSFDQNSLAVNNTASIAGWGNSGADSYNQLESHEEGYFIVQAPTNGQGKSIGLSSNSPDDHFNTTEYAFLFSAGNTVQITENGIIQYNLGNYNQEDIFKIERDENGTINYYKNNQLKHQSVVSDFSPKRLDISFYDLSSFSYVRTSFLPKVFTIQTLNEDALSFDLSGAGISSSNNSCDGTEYVFEPIFSNTSEPITLIYRLDNADYDLQLTFDLYKTDNSIGNIQLFTLNHFTGVLTPFPNLAPWDLNGYLFSPVFNPGITISLFKGLFTPNNWSQIKTYDLDGNPTSESRQYQDLFGRDIQSKSKNFEHNQYITHMNIFDAYGNQAISTLPAFGGNTIHFNPTFIEAEGGYSYQAAHFDTETSFNNPSPVKNSVPHSLGYFYSSQGEAFVPEDQFPYIRTFYSADPLQEVRGSSGIGNEMKMGSGHEQLSFKMNTQGELDVIYGIGEHYKSERDINNSLNSLALSNAGSVMAYKNIVIDADGNEYISYTDGKGNLLAKCRSGVNSTCPKVESSKDMQAYGSRSVDIHLPISCQSDIEIKLPSYQIGGNTHYINFNEVDIRITNLETSKLIPSNGTGAYFISTISTSPYIGSIDFSNVPDMPRFIRISFEYKDWKIDHFDANGVTYPDLDLSYKLDYSYWTLNYYDLSGRLLKTLSPKETLCNGSGQNSSVFSSFDYDKFNNVIAKSIPDEGIVEYLYDEENQLRFSQNAYQKTRGEFSYLNYDQFGNIIQSGQYRYVGADINRYAFQNTYASPPLPSGTTSILSVIHLSNPFHEGDCNEIKKYYYNRLGDNEQLNNPSNTYSYKSQFTTNYLMGGLSRVENDQSIQWYSYDQQGRVIWMVQQYLDPTFAAKPIDDQFHSHHYTYNNKNQLEETVYQKYTSEKRSIEPTYNNDNQLTLSLMKRNGVEIARNAYTYYQNGALKRNLMGNDLQGIDYTYTISGALKAINHPVLDPQKDPGGDGHLNNVREDLFGMALDYYENDYVRTGTNFKSHASAYLPGYYNGRINSVRWNTNKDAKIHRTAGLGGDVTLYASTEGQLMYNLSYDEHMRMQKATFGTFNGNGGYFTSRNEYLVGGTGGIEYDAIGNITHLERQGYELGNASANYAMDNLDYTYANHSSQLTEITDHVGGSILDDFSVFSSLNDYHYDANGRLSSSQPDNVSNIYYYSDGLIHKVVYGNGNKLEYFYDAGGNKIRTIETIGGNTFTTFYIRDANAALVAIYEQDLSINNNIDLKSYHTDNAIYQINGSGGVSDYQITDHLGNVRLVINETPANGNNYTVVSWADYYPFGRPMPGRSMNAGSNRFGHAGQESTGSSRWTQYPLRMYSADLGRFLSPDPYGQFHSPYIAMGNKPMQYIDPTGGFLATYEINYSNFLNKIYNRGLLERYLNGYSVLLKLFWGISYEEQFYMASGGMGAPESTPLDNVPSAGSMDSWYSMEIADIYADLISYGQIDKQTSYKIIRFFGFPADLMDTRTKRERYWKKRERRKQARQEKRKAKNKDANASNVSILNKDFTGLSGEALAMALAGETYEGSLGRSGYGICEGCKSKNIEINRVAGNYVHTETSITKDGEVKIRTITKTLYPASELHNRNYLFDNNFEQHTVTTRFHPDGRVEFSAAAKVSVLENIAKKLDIYKSIHEHRNTTDYFLLYKSILKQASFFIPLSPPFFAF